MCETRMNSLWDWTTRCKTTYREWRKTTYREKNDIMLTSVPNKMETFFARNSKNIRIGGCRSCGKSWNYGWIIKHVCILYPYHLWLNHWWVSCYMCNHLSYSERLQTQRRFAAKCFGTICIFPRNLYVIALCMELFAIRHFVSFSHPYRWLWQIFEHCEMILMKFLSIAIYKW